MARQGSTRFRRRRKYGNAKCRTTELGFDVCIYEIPEGKYVWEQNEVLFYEVVCEEHGPSLFAKTLQEAMSFDPLEFCAVCQEMEAKMAKKKSGLGSAPSEHVQDAHESKMRAAAAYRQSAAASKKGSCSVALTKMLRGELELGSAIANEIGARYHMPSNIRSIRNSAKSSYTRNCKPAKKAKKK